MSKQLERVRIGQLLLKAGALSEEQLGNQLEVAKTIGQPLGQILLQSGLLTRYQLICAVQVQSMILDKALSSELGIEALKLVCLQNYDLSEACRSVGLSKEKAWTCKLGELLVGAGIISTRQLLDSIATSLQTSVPLGQILVRGKKVRPDVIAAGLNLQRQVRSGALTLEKAIEKLQTSQGSEPTSNLSQSQADPLSSSIKTPLEMTGEFQAGTLDQVDEILWKRIRRERLEEQDQDQTPQQLAEEMIGALLADRYEVISFIGAGGMSFVYLVRNRSIDRVLALKMMQPRLRRDQEMIMRFKQEAQTVSSLDHPNVVAVHDFGVTDEGRFFIVMDYVSGLSLAELISKEGRLPVERALPIILQACYAVAHAHARGIIHRDLKPSNIMLSTLDSKADFVKIVDFGIAKLQPADGGIDHKLTRSGQLFGSPLYMSPERCMGRTLDVRSDIYSMGCVLYEALTGHPPFIGATVYEIFYKHMQQKPPGLAKLVFDKELCKEVEAIIATCLAKEPVNRYQSMAQLLEALEQAAALSAPAKTAAVIERPLTLIAEILVKSGLLSREMLNQRLEISQAIGQPLGQTLLQFGDLTENQLISAVQVQSLYHDKVLPIDQVIEAIQIVRKDNVCLEEALEQIGFIDRVGWTNRLGELLLASHQLTEASLHKALFLALKECRPLGHILVNEGMVKPTIVAKALSVQKRIREGLLKQDEGLKELQLAPAEETLFL